MLYQSLDKWYLLLHNIPVSGYKQRAAPESETVALHSCSSITSSVATSVSPVIVVTRNTPLVTQPHQYGENEQ